MARRNLKQEQFRRKYHRQLVKRSTQKPRGVMPKPGSAKRALAGPRHPSTSLKITMSVDTASTLNS